MIKIVVNATTGEVTEVPMTPEEIQRKEDRKIALEEAAAQKQSERTAQRAARDSALAKLTALGLTEEEARAITG